MRLIPLSLLLFISVTCFGQSTIPPRKKDAVVYQGTMVVDSMAQNQLFKRAADYFITYFSTTKSFIYKIDQGLGQIIIKPCVNFPFKRDGGEYSGGLWHYTGIFTFTDGKYRYRLDSFYNTDFMFGTPSRQDLGPVECLYEDSKCPPTLLNIRLSQNENRAILKNLHKTMVAFMKDFDDAMRKK